MLGAKETHETRVANFTEREQAERERAERLARMDANRRALRARLSSQVATVRAHILLRQAEAALAMDRAIAAQQAAVQEFAARSAATRRQMERVRQQFERSRGERRDRVTEPVR